MTREALARFNLRLAARARRKAAFDLNEAVINARAINLSWSEIGDELGLTKAGAYAIGRTLMLTGEKTPPDRDMRQRMGAAGVCT